jgi:hypothetical protein
VIGKNIWLTAAVAAVGCVDGCFCDQIGMSPPGLSSEEMRQAFNNLPLDQRAQQLLDVPGPMGNKVARIEGWYKQAGQPIPDSLKRRLGIRDAVPGPSSEGDDTSAGSNDSSTSKKG